MDNLRDALIRKAQMASGLGTAAAPAPTAPTGLPAHPPNESAGTPPAWKRYATSLAMQQAYANGWNPNPLLIRALGGSKS